LKQQQMAHACEWETSMVLSIAPHLVGDFQSAKSVESKGQFAAGSRAWVTRERSKSGHIGQPHAATPEKGVALLNLFSTGVVSLLKRVIAWDGKSW
jgi:creatinine amidohydrolase